MRPVRSNVGYVALVAMLCCTLVQAEPSPAVRYLMSKPASLFDLGMLNLQDRIRRVVADADPPFMFAGKYAEVTATYDYSLNRITVGVAYSGKVAQLPAVNEVESTCTRQLIRLRSILVPPNTVPGIGRSFMHADLNYEEADRPPDVSAQLDKITRVWIWIMLWDAKPEHLFSLSCEGSITGAEVTVTKP